MPETMAVQAVAQTLDIALEKNKKPGFETRYDIANIDLSGPQPQITSRLGRKFTLIAEVVTRRGGAKAAWNALANDDPERIAEMVGTKALVAWARNKSFEIDGHIYHTLQQWLDAQESPPEDVEVEQVPDVPMKGARKVARASGALIRVLGFTPTHAIPIKE